MTLRSLTPSGNGGTRTSPSLNPFGFSHREIDRLFEDFTRGTPDVPGAAQVTLVPSIDVTETDSEIVVSAEMPGLERDDVEITVEDDVLTIRGEKKVEREEGVPKPSRSQPQKIEVREAAQRSGQDQAGSGGAAKSGTDKAQKGAAYRAQGSSS